MSARSRLTRAKAYATDLALRLALRSGWTCIGRAAPGRAAPGRAARPGRAGRAALGRGRRRAAASGAVLARGEMELRRQGRVPIRRGGARGAPRLESELVRADRAIRAAHRRSHRALGSLRLSAAQGGGCAGHVRTTGSLPGVPTHQFRASGCATGAPDPWIEGSHGLTRELAQPRGGPACGAAVTLRLYERAGHSDTVAALSLPARRRASTMADSERSGPQAAWDAAAAGVA